MEIRTAFDVGDKVEFEPWGMEPMTIGEILSIVVYIDIQKQVAVQYNVRGEHDKTYTLYEEDIQHASELQASQGVQS